MHSMQQLDIWLVGLIIQIIILQHNILIELWYLASSCAHDFILILRKLIFNHDRPQNLPIHALVRSSDCLEIINVYWKMRKQTQTRKMRKNHIYLQLRIFWNTFLSIKLTSKYFGWYALSLSRRIGWFLKY